jgi:anti-sigma B factor antagonist
MIFEILLQPLECKPMALEINARVLGDIVVLDMAGRLWVRDLSLHERVQTLLAGGYRYFVFNIANVDFIDSSGLGQLISIWTSVRSRSGNVNLLRPTERVRRLLTVTRLHVVFDVFDDEERAKVAVHRDWPA